MAFLLTHLPILPILLPMLAGTLLLFSSDSRHGPRLALSILALLAQFAIALLLLAGSDGRLALPGRNQSGFTPSAAGSPLRHCPGQDRLSAIMVLLTATLGLAALVYSVARWEKAGVHYLPLFQFLLMGLNGSFLTGDLFNLFVFFEIMLAASYGLLLHASGGPRVRAGLHYIVVNLVASLVFLIGIALVYGLTGTLNLAELPLRIAALPATDRALFNSAAALLGVVFLTKAAAWPLNFWLPAAYGHAVPPVGAIFAILTKVGVYVLLRLGVLFRKAAARHRHRSVATGCSTAVWPPCSAALSASSAASRWTGWRRFWSLSPPAPCSPPSVSPAPCSPDRPSTIWSARFWAAAPSSC